MKSVAILLIALYQDYVSFILKNILGVRRFCRFTPTCSEYTKQMIITKGFTEGMSLSLQRLIRCQPFYG